MLKRLSRLILLLCLCTGSLSGAAPVRLVVVISIDEFRYDYLTRWRQYYGQDGFLRLVKNGANFTNATYKHAVNKTGPGHAVILTGAYGDQNGIIANRWFDRRSQQLLYCVADSSVSLVGASGAGLSPANLITPTVGDELRLHTSFRSKVISLSYKDRSAILMGGKWPTGVFWMIDSTFVSSTYYMQSLPSWVRNFNAAGIANSYFGKIWRRTLPDAAYQTMDLDDVPYESNWSTIGRAFPHPVRGKDSTRITKSYYNALITSPYGDEVLAALAKAAIEGEQLGAGTYTDLLCISFSACDYVGHSFGPHSREIIEMTVSLDRLLADFLRYLDTRIGLRRAIVVLTSDHGMSPIPEYIRSHHPKADVGRISRATIETYCNEALNKTYGKRKTERTWVRRILDGNIYLNLEVIAAQGLDIDHVSATLADSLVHLHEIALALPRRVLAAGPPQSSLAAKLGKGFHPKRSGDVVFALKPFFIEDAEGEGTEHGNPYEYDAHVPLLIMGEGIRKGTYATECSPADIAPTLSALLGIEFPAAREGRVLIEALKTP
jgi:predicted AlkP superfamily pyrophosphatase or phosphodiesterase